MKLYMPLIIATLGVGLVTGAVSAQDEIDYTEMVEDLKVMCRVVDETMEEVFEKDYLKGGFFRRGGCQHLYLKGYGAVFLFDVQFPVAEKEMRVVKTKKKTNMWEKYEREVRHQNQLEETVWMVGKNESYSKEKVDKLKEQLAYLVGEYGSRIGQLESDDTISFVVFGYSDHTIDLDVDLDFGWHIVGDALSHAQETLEARAKEAKEVAEKMKEITEQESQDDDEKDIIQQGKAIAEGENRDDDEKIIIQKSKAIIIEGEKDREIEDSEIKKEIRLRLLAPVPPVPPTPPSLPHGFHGKPVTTLILTFKRSQLEGKKGADWEALLTTAEVVEY